MTLNDRDIWICPTISSGIKIGNLQLDYALAAQWWGFDSLEDFRELDEMVQAHNVAVWRTKGQMDGVLAYKQDRKSKRNTRKKGKKG